jgi:hypothetical protein
VKPAELFERFKKDSPLEESLGLGLSIVKTIADSYWFAIGYYYKEQKHVLEILFS